MRHVRLEDEIVQADYLQDGSFRHREYFQEAKDEAERKEWIQKPENNVPENLLPLIKASYMCYSQGEGLRNKFLKQIENRIINANMRQDPSRKNYEKSLDAFVNKAKGNPSRKYL